MRSGGPAPQVFPASSTPPDLVRRHRENLRGRCAVLNTNVVSRRKSAPSGIAAAKVCQRLDDRIAQVSMIVAWRSVSYALSIWPRDGHFLKSRALKMPVSRSGRFASGPAADVVAFSDSISFDHRLWLQDIIGSMAHD